MRGEISILSEIERNKDSKKKKKKKSWEGYKKA